MNPIKSKVVVGAIFAYTCNHVLNSTGNNVSTENATVIAAIASKKFMATMQRNTNFVMLVSTLIIKSNY